MIYAVKWKKNYMKTKNLFIGLGIAAGAFLTVAALNKNNKKVREFVNSKIKQVTGKKDSTNDKDVNYV